MLSIFLKGEEILKEDLQKYLAGKEKTGKVQLRYIDDIHVIDVFFASKQCNSWVCDTRSVGMSVIQCNTMA